MKWNVLFGTLLLGFGLSAQSYGFDLLDRMLGVGGGGCDPCAVKCGVEPKCGVDPKCGVEPKCGCEPKGCDPKGCAQKNCGAAQKDCGKGCAVGNRGHLFDGLFNCNRCGDCGGKGCDPKCGAEPKCGVEPKCGCDPKGCDAKHCGAAQKDCGKGGACGTRRPLFDGLFGSRCNACGKGDCCANDCCEGKGVKGGNGKAKASAEKDAPMPPAPVVDPSAFLNTRTVIPASRIVR